MTPTSTKNKTIYVNGCSFAFGMGVHLSETVTRDLRFSRTLADMLGVLDDNRAIPGSCNHRISRRSVIDLISTKPDLAIVIWSDPARFEFISRDTKMGSYRFNEDAEQVRPLSIYKYPRNQRHTFLSYYENISSTQRDVLYTLQNMVSVKIAADMMKIPCIQIPFKGTFHRELIRAQGWHNPDYISSINDHTDILSSDKLIFGINDDISFDSIAGVDKDQSLLSTIPDQGGHPGKEAHDIMAKWLKKLIEEYDLLK